MPLAMNPLGRNSKDTGVRQAQLHPLTHFFKTHSLFSQGISRGFLRIC